STSEYLSPLCFFFQAEDGIRDRNVTGVQTCALPISFLIVKAVASEIAARCDVQPMSGRRNTNLYGNRIVTVAGVPVPDRHPVMLTVALLGYSPARPSAFRMVAKTESCDTPGSATTAM